VWYVRDGEREKQGGSYLRNDDERRGEVALVTRELDFCTHNRFAFTEVRALEEVCVAGCCPPHWCSHQSLFLVLCYRVMMFFLFSLYDVFWIDAEKGKQQRRVCFCYFVSVQLVQ
jgi:hypothetical protein